jgi:RNA polymerase sigma-70 factor (ECF subfamily)
VQAPRGAHASYSIARTLRRPPTLLGAEVNCGGRSQWTEPCNVSAVSCVCIAGYQWACVEQAPRGSIVAVTQGNVSALISAAASGTPEALAELYNLYSPSLWRLALRFLKSPQDAEDVVHDLYVGLPSALTKYVEQGSFEAWLKRVLIRLALSRIRRNRRLSEYDLDAAANTSVGSTRAEEVLELRAAIEDLPEPLQQVLVLSQLEGYSHEEVGSLLGISPGASRVRLVRALQRLRKQLGTV